MMKRKMFRLFSHPTSPPRPFSEHVDLESEVGNQNISDPQTVEDNSDIENDSDVENHSDVEKSKDFFVQALKDPSPFVFDLTCENLTNILGELDSAHSNEGLSDFVNFCKVCKINVTDLNKKFKLMSIPKGDTKRKLLEEFPNWKCGRFSSAEDSRIIKNFGSLANELKLDLKEAEKLMVDLTNLPRSAMMCRLYFAAIVGLGLDTRRLSIDIYHRTVSIIQASRQDQIISEMKNNPSSASSMDLGLKIRPKKLKEVLQKVNDQKAAESRRLQAGQYKLSESFKMIDIIMKQQRGRKMNAASQMIDFKKIDFKKIGDQMQRKERSVRQHFNSVIVPALTHDEIDHVVANSWKRKLMEILYADPDIESRRDINWDRVSEEIGLPNESIRTIFKNNFISSASMTFKESLQICMMNAEAKLIEMKDAAKGDAATSYIKYTKIKNYYKLKYEKK